MTKKEERIYEFEEKEKYRQNLSSLKALGVGMMVVKNPKMDDSFENLQEIFIIDQIPIAKDSKSNEKILIDNTKIRELLRDESGFQFQNVMRNNYRNSVK